MKAKKIRVIHYGLGPIGLATAKLVLTKPDMEIVGAVDIAKEMVGKDLGEILGVQPLGVHVTDNAERLFAKVQADVVVHTAGSRLKRIVGQVEEILRGGKNLVSSAEELLFATPENAEAAARIDKLAREKGVTVLGTGVNPGFVMDALPLTLTGVCAGGPGGPRGAGRRRRHAPLPPPAEDRGGDDAGALPGKGRRKGDGPCRPPGIALSDRRPPALRSR